MPRSRSSASAGGGVQPWHAIEKHILRKATFRALWATTSEACCGSAEVRMVASLTTPCSL
ncbi:unnamed protein product [Symbiodinium sp. CCMP2592]|nr:unnamed protein product [Symbiodinium sp. CCMP2592]